LFGSLLEDEIAELSGERPREPGPCKSVGVKGEHEIAASGAQPLVEREPLAGPTRRQRAAGRRGNAVLTGRGGAVGGGVVVHDDDLGELAGANDRHAASARGA
jgi:hypothetical protein